MASAAVILTGFGGSGAAFAVTTPSCPETGCPTSAAPTPTPTDTVTADPTDPATAYPTAPDPTATETDLVPAPTDTSVDMSGPVPTDAALPGAVSPDRVYCDPGWDNKLSRNYGRFLFAVGVEQEDKNGTKKPFAADFSETTSARVGVSFSGSFEGKVGAFIAEVKSTFNVTVSADLTVSVGNTVHPIVDPGHTLYGRYGVYRDKITGTSTYISTNCTTSGTHSFTGYAPISLGWDVWES